MPPACRASAPLRQALGSKLSLCTYSRVLLCLRRITARAGRVWVVGSHKAGKVRDEASVVCGVVPVNSVDWEGIL